MVVPVCHVSIFGRRSVCQSFLSSRAAPTRPKSEKPRKSREGKRSKRLKRQQPQRKEKYRKRQCRANHQQHHELSKLSATHDVQHQRSGKKFHGGARSHAAEMMRFRLCSELGPLGIRIFWAEIIQLSPPILFGLALHRRCRQPPLKVIERLAIVSTGRNRLFQVPVPP